MADAASRLATATHLASPVTILTYKRHGKSVSESLPDQTARCKVERTLTAYREFQELSRQPLDVNPAICRQRPPASAGAV